ncbi:hypothetical protein SAMD00019534_067280 [Acytostelium subglobosum LB1]|uniref:hypothetical protein n=1 Tax=Acytostelium subglobosum LB1 TaxID=1410327 RepID=UPI0006448D25|nr:hypothetical protein SAMD00019534_067280 [Acytostelium subglobosum LB1]GAM23553.1 hypothetical protein SAMD00019534_067280 [Acytostelium subglobosum LB1]|eukprot:XP_012753294.1 hypothetical protein SAMD00019534_067280 [Acytostelium subglobosum LB1]
MGSGSSKLTDADLAYMSQQTNLSKGEVAKLFEEFKKFDKDGSGALERTEFISLLKVRLPNFPEQRMSDLFNAFDTDRSGTIDFKELSVAIGVIGHGSKEEKLNLLFDVFDRDKSGTLEKVEIDQLIRLIIQIGKSLGKPEKDLDHFVRALFQKIDADKSSTISRDEWVTEGSRTPSLLFLLGVSAGTQ